MSLKVDISMKDDIAVMRCRGRIVFGEESDELRQAILGLLRKTSRIVLDLAWVDHIDSSGLGTLVASFISARHRNAEVKFGGMSPRAEQALTTTHVNQLFEMYGSTDAAIQSFRPRRQAAGDRLGLTQSLAVGPAWSSMFRLRG